MCFDVQFATKNYFLRKTNMILYQKVKIHHGLHDGNDRCGKVLEPTKYVQQIHVSLVRHLSHPLG